MENEQAQEQLPDPVFVEEGQGDSDGKITDRPDGVETGAKVTDRTPSLSFEFIQPDPVSTYDRVKRELKKYLDDDPNHRINTRYFRRLRPDEKEAVYENREDFVNNFRDYAQFSLSGPWIEYFYENNKKKEGIIAHKKQNAARRLKNHIEQVTQNMIDDGVLTDGFYYLDTSNEKRPKLTHDFQLLVNYRPELLPLEAMPTENLEVIEGFEKLSQENRIILYQKLMDMRDRKTTTTKELKKAGLKDNSLKMARKLFKGGHFYEYKFKDNELIGVHALKGKK